MTSLKRSSAVFSLFVFALILQLQMSDARAGALRITRSDNQETIATGSGGSIDFYLKNISRTDIVTILDINTEDSVFLAGSPNSVLTGTDVVGEDLCESLTLRPFQSCRFTQTFTSDDLLDGTGRGFARALFRIRNSTLFTIDGGATEELVFGSAKVLLVNTTNATVPEPATMVLLGTGLAGIGAAVRRRRKHGQKS